MKFMKVALCRGCLSCRHCFVRGSLTIVYDIDGVGSRCWPEDPGIRQWPVYIHIRKRRAIWISASVVAHHREITPLYLIDNGNRLRGRKWLRLPREDGSTMVFALWLFNLPQRSISSLLCLSCISYICSSLAYLYLSYFSFNLIYLLFFYYLIYSLFIILKT